MLRLVVMPQPSHAVGELTPLGPGAQQLVRRRSPADRTAEGLQRIVLLQNLIFCVGAPSIEDHVLGTSLGLGNGHIAPGQKPDLFSFWYRQRILHVHSPS